MILTVDMDVDQRGKFWEEAVNTEIKPSKIEEWKKIEHNRHHRDKDIHWENLKY
jgi:hypothetical protein